MTPHAGMAQRRWPLRRRPRGASLRARVTVVASLGITAAVVAGLLLMFQLQTSSVRGTIDIQLRTYATQIVQSHTHGGWPTPLPGSTLDGNAEAQVIAGDGRVLAATRTLVGVPTVYRLPAGATSPVRQKAADGIVPTDIRVVAQRATIDDRLVTIVTGTSTGLLSTVNESFVHYLLIGLPIVLLLSALAVWLVVGRSLRPVNRIRTAVTAITADDLSRRVPEPSTADEVGLLARTMNDMLARLEGSATKQRRFVADASHELRSPLAAIRTTLEVGLAHPDTAPWPIIAQRASSQSGRLEELIQQLLLLAKADEHTLTGRRQEIDLCKMLHEIRDELPAHPLDISVTTSPDTVTRGNPEHLRRVLRNVIDNAVRYAKTTISIHTVAQEQTITITVDDDGPGVPDADRERVFDRFVRLDTSRGRGSGTTGLGLAIAREIARAHDATMSMSRSAAGGARVTICLPRTPPAGRESRGPPAR